MQKANLKSKAFEYEQGQFICHVFAPLDADNFPPLEDLIDCLKADQESSWKPLSNHDNNSEGNFHLTLLRGHRAIYNHQIRPLVAKLNDECGALKSFKICLDQLKIFNNPEKTKQFLVLASRPGSISSNLESLKRAVKTCVDTFATKLTQEDDTSDTLPHCSLMQRDTPDGATCEKHLELELARISNLCPEFQAENDSCCVQIGPIILKVGHREYVIPLM